MFMHLCCEKCGHNFDSITFEHFCPVCIEQTVTPLLGIGEITPAAIEEAALVVANMPSRNLDESMARVGAFQEYLQCYVERRIYNEMVG